MAKKKKKEKVSDFLWFANYVPGISSTNTNMSLSGGSSSRYQYSYTINRPGPALGYLDDMSGQAVNAFLEYTFTGPLELMGAKSAGQAGILASAGTYSSFRTGLAIELGMDFVGLGVVLTITDPANKWEGGLDEWGVFGGNSGVSLPGTMSGEAPTPFVWGLQQGHLGFLFGG